MALKNETTKFDVIIIGAGPNGLQIGAYLSKAGLKALILERRLEVGGGLASEAVTAYDCLHNTHAVYMMMTEFAPIYEDLKLEERYKVQHIYPPLQFALPTRDGRCLCLYTDVEKTFKSIAAFSEKDANSYRELYHTYKRYVDEVIAPGTYVPPTPTLDHIVLAQKTEIGREMTELAMKTPMEIIDENFEHPVVKALMLYVATQWGVGYDSPGMGFLVALYINRATNYRLVKGGSHMVAQALHKVVHQNGSLVRSGQLIERIIVEDGVAKAVELVDGTVLEASKAIVSTLNPHQTFLQLVGEQNLEKGLTDMIKSWRWERHSFVTTHIALREVPNFTAAAADPEINRAFVYVLGFESPEELIADMEAVDNGELQETAIFNCCFPSIHDPLQAPPGKCTALLSRHAPYKLKDGGSDKWYSMDYKREVADQCMRALQTYAPNMNSDNVIWDYVSTPVDIENKFLDMKEGSYKQGLYDPLQMGYHRPNEMCSSTRTPIKNLYVGGASVYPGGCVIWGPGYLCANAVAEDTGTDKWWKEPEYITKAREDGKV